MSKVFIKTFGCTANVHDSEVMAGLLLEAGYELTGKPEDADILITNICTVKGDKKALKEIRKAKGLQKKDNKRKSKKIVIAGCIPADLMQKIKEELPCASIVDTHNIQQIVAVVKELEAEKTITLSGYKKIIKINIPKIRRNKTAGIVPILSGCNGSCAYCSVKLIKGELFSYPENKIIDEVKNCLKDGCKEIWITSQDNACYNLDKKREEKEKTKLPELLREICKIKGNFKVRVGMMNPNNVLPVLKELIDVYKNEKIFKFLHIPVQSGNNEILKKMGRKYSVRDFKKIILEFRKNFSKITISTDIICGFPTESEQQFMGSIKLLKEIKPDIVNISRFQPRYGTAAMKMPQVHGNITKKRSTLLAKEFEKIALEKNKQWISWQGKALVDETGKKGTKTIIARNYCYKPIVIKAEKKKLKLGQEINVKIIDATKHDLRGVWHKRRPRQQTNQYF